MAETDLVCQTVGVHPVDRRAGSFGRIICDSRLSKSKICPISEIWYNGAIKIYFRRVSINSMLVMYMYQLTFDFNTSILRHTSNLGLADPNRSPSIGWFSLGLSDASQIQYTQPHSANPRFAHHCPVLFGPRDHLTRACVFSAESFLATSYF